ncbi:MAG: GNAT family N-acetyltransferase [Halomonadaceae bacterium]|uniref:GNAT family N-acetyltransferase n=1 Tax=Halomonas colorata TaxID=2742615 RepID=A0ABR9G2R4_9GAMM|nr:GNAT family N-acetyltransferase [Halomonas colorata]MBE0465196.1 GNAT family N-acetyltransferase [Halomonas colorata]
MLRRKARKDDGAVVWHIYRSAYREVVERQFGVWEDKLQKSAFDEKWCQGGFEVLTLNGETIGAVWITWEENLIQLREVFLAPDHQGQRVGFQVLSEILAKARYEGLMLRLRVLKQSRAVRFYERLGFKHCGETVTQYWMEAV